MSETSVPETVTILKSQYDGLLYELCLYKELAEEELQLATRHREIRFWEKRLKTINITFDECVARIKN